MASRAQMPAGAAPFAPPSSLATGRLGRHLGAMLKAPAMWPGQDYARYGACSAASGLLDVDPRSNLAAPASPRQRGHFLGAAI